MSLTLQDIQYHIEQYGCSLDPYEEDSYWAANCINGNCCVIEALEDYSSVTLCHYFYELGIPAPDELHHEMEAYREMRSKVAKLAIAEDAPEEGE